LTVTWVYAGSGEDACRRRGAAVRGGGVDLHPPEMVHGVDNISEKALTYVSAATVDWRAFYDEGPLRPRNP
jgi:hypothetical protein